MSKFNVSLTNMNDKVSSDGFGVFTNTLYFNDDVKPYTYYSSHIRPYGYFQNDFRYVPFVYYISDLHIDLARSKSISMDDITRRLIRDIFRNLSKAYRFVDGHNCDVMVCFLGDYSDTNSDTLSFFEMFDKKLYKAISNKFNQYFLKRVLLNLKIIIISGNHDYVNIHTESPYDADDVLVDKFSKFKNFNFKTYYLNDDCIEFNNLFVVGGTGWACNNTKFNSSNLVGPKNYDYAYEKYHSDKLNNLLKESSIKAKLKGKPLLCLSHYPSDDWISKDIDLDYHPIVFLNGHTHRNVVQNKGLSFELSDNQIGSNIRLKRYVFKSVQLSPLINPYLDVNKFRKTSLDEIASFYRYKSMMVGLKYMLNNNVDEFYIMKYKDYYLLIAYHPKYKHFFVMSGGKFRVKNLLNFESLEDIYNWFSIIVDSLVNSRFHEFNIKMIELSNFLKLLGLSGRKHGLIVDLDYENHIMINPLTNSLILYEAEQELWYRGVILIPKNELNHLIGVFLERNGSFHIENRELVPHFKNLVSNLNNYILDRLGDFLYDEDEDFYYVDKKFVDYSLSRKYFDLANLFDKKILLNNYDIGNVDSNRLLE